MRTLTAQQRLETTVLVDRQFRLGENPLWDDHAGVLCWTDIGAGEVWRWGEQTRESRCIYRGPRVGGFTLEEDGSLLLFRERDIALLRPLGGRDARPRVMTTFDDVGTERFNDVIACPDGSVLAGTIGRSCESGGLYHVSRGVNGTIVVESLFRGTGISNGLAFTRDLTRLLWTCSTSRRIYRFGMDARFRPSGRPDVFLELPESEATPDGMTIDVEGFIWTAIWGASCVRRYAPDGRLDREIAVPTLNVTSLTFGGPDLATLFVTASEGPVYAFAPGVRGVPEFRSCLG